MPSTAHLARRTQLIKILRELKLENQAVFYPTEAPHTGFSNAKDILQFSDEKYAEIYRSKSDDLLDYYLLAIARAIQNGLINHALESHVPLYSTAIEQLEQFAKTIKTSIRVCKELYLSPFMAEKLGGTESPMQAAEISKLLIQAETRPETQADANNAKAISALIQRTLKGKHGAKFSVPENKDATATPNSDTSLQSSASLVKKQ